MTFFQRIARPIFARGVLERALRIGVRIYKDSASYQHLQPPLSWMGEVEIPKGADYAGFLVGMQRFFLRPVDLYFWGHSESMAGNTWMSCEITITTGVIPQDIESVLGRCLESAVKNERPA